MRVLHTNCRSAQPRRWRGQAYRSTTALWCTHARTWQCGLVQRPTSSLPGASGHSCSRRYRYRIGGRVVELPRLDERHLVHVERLLQGDGRAELRRPPPPRAELLPRKHPPPVGVVHLHVPHLAPPVPDGVPGFAKQVAHSLRENVPCGALVPHKGAHGVVVERTPDPESGSDRHQLVAVPQFEELLLDGALSAVVAHPHQQLEEVLGEPRGGGAVVALEAAQALLEAVAEGEPEAPRCAPHLALAVPPHTARRQVDAVAL
mmetsp:Transcript_28006/g.61301  ORF Transcript_28006/g.61301 Transcript_28006/m.61301 type:complete len:261 (-) Transcript_28006:965-1747(-)